MTPLREWLTRNHVKIVRLATETSLPRPHISRYSLGSLRPTAEKAALLSAATSRITNGCDVLSVEALLFPDGLPIGAVIGRTCTSHCDESAEAA